MSRPQAWMLQTGSCYASLWQKCDYHCTEIITEKYKWHRISKWLNKRTHCFALKS